MVGFGNDCSYDENIVSVWLKFLNIEEYTEQFIDNGYDDLETVKLMGKEDLKAIGIDNQKDEDMILHSVKILREQGATWVYLLLGDAEEEGTQTLSSGKMSISEDEEVSSYRRRKSSRRTVSNREIGETLLRLSFLFTLQFDFQNLCNVWRKILILLSCLQILAAALLKIVKIVLGFLQLERHF